MDLQGLQDLLSRWHRREQHYQAAARKYPDDADRWNAAALVVRQSRMELRAGLHDTVHGALPECIAAPLPDSVAISPQGSADQRREYESVD